MQSSSRLMKGVGPVLLVEVGVHLGRLDEGCRTELTVLIGDVTVTGDENRLRLVGLMTPDIAVTEFMLG